MRSEVVLEVPRAGFGAEGSFWPRFPNAGPVMSSLLLCVFAFPGGGRKQKLLLPGVNMVSSVISKLDIWRKGDRDRRLSLAWFCLSAVVEKSAVSPHHLVNVLAGVCSSRKPNTNLVGCCRQALKWPGTCQRSRVIWLQKDWSRRGQENTWGWN